ncbi:hypothetical protein HZS_2607, partial [Henneguya salminicola]
FLGHTGPVRDIAILQINTNFLSCGNDCTIRLWDINNGQCLKVFTSHKNFVYSLVTNPTVFLSFVSCGEENSLKVWSDLKKVDDIVVPGLLNWCVCILPNSDIVVTSSFPDVMIFTRDKARIANEISNEEFSFLIRESLNDQPDLKDIDINSLASADYRAFTQGAHDGQKKMFRQDDQIVVYQWNLKSGKWIFLGRALRGINKDKKRSSKIIYEGVEYDHVIDVELENCQKLKLPYNIGEDPEDAATRFIEKNSLDTIYHKKMVDLLITKVHSAAYHKNNHQITTIKLHTDSDFTSTNFIVFKSTNIFSLFNRLKILCPNTNLDELLKIEKNVGSCINQTKNNFFRTEFLWNLLNDMFIIGGAVLLPILDIIKQLVIFEDFYYDFFFDRKNCYNFDLIEFL